MIKHLEGFMRSRNASPVSFPLSILCSTVFVKSVRLVVVEWSGWNPDWWTDTVRCYESVNSRIPFCGRLFPELSRKLVGLK